MEMMQINVVFEPPTPVKPQNGSFDEDDDQDKDKQSGGESDNEEGVKKEGAKLTEDQAFMKDMLEKKKVMVIKELIKILSHINSKDQEASLNARAVLIELIETEKTFELFMMNEAELVK